ncbi:MAG: hypothetical protein AAFR16_02700, partial [Pseudomonadota bacterium]
PQLRAGDTFVFTGGRVRQVSKIEGDRVTWRNRKRDLFVSSRDFFTPRLLQRKRAEVVSRFFDFPRKPQSLWPLSVGKSVQFVVNTRIQPNDMDAYRLNIRYWRCEVRSKDLTETPAGAFDTYRIRCRSYARPDQMDLAWFYRIETTYDYAPEINHFVRRTFRSRKGGTRFKTALEAYLPARRATRVRIDDAVARARDPS